MAAPRKPWESNNKSDINNYSNNLLDANISRTQATNNFLNPPPLPPRYNPYSNASVLPSYNSSPYSYANYGGFGTGYGTGFNNLGTGYGYQQYGQQFGSSLAQQADIGSRQAFQSVESMVRAFGSVAMMLDSTYQAVFNSFRAVIGVADHFSRMRLQFSQILSSLALLRTLRWIWMRIRAIFGSETADYVWKNSAQQVANELLNRKIGNKNWPLLLFFAIIFGGPFLLWKLFSSFSEPAGWATGQGDHYLAVGDYDFDAEMDQEISFKKGSQIFLAPKDLQPKQRGWLLASVDGKKIGLIPQNYIHIIDKRNGTENNITSSANNIPDIINLNANSEQVEN